MAESSNQFTGIVLGNIVQAGTVRDIHVHTAPPPYRVPRQLPARPGHFTSRRHELSRLTWVLNQDGPFVVVLSGPGGVGKTALATQWAWDVSDRFPDGQLFVDLRGADGRSPADPSEILAGFLEVMGIAPVHHPHTLAQLTALYRSVTADRALLVVADNAYSAAQVKVLIPASPAAGFLVTSRSRLPALIPEGGQIIEVEPLPPTDSIALLQSTVGDDRIRRELDQAENLVHLCGGLPIALTIAAARLVVRPRLSLRRMASELSDEAGRLAGLSLTEGTSVQVTFDHSYRSLDPYAAALYRRIALHPGHEFGGGPVASLVLGLKDLAPEAPMVNPLDGLLESNLLAEVSEGRFTFHDLIRLHARQKADADESPADRERALTTILEWYLTAAGRADLVVTPYRRRLPWKTTVPLADLPDFTTRESALGWLSRERQNLVAAGRAAQSHGLYELSWHLSDVMWPLLLNEKHYIDRLDVDLRGVAAAEYWGNVPAKADMLKRLSRTLATRREFTAAEKRARAAISAYETVNDRRGVLDAQEILASIYRDSGRESDAVDILTRTLAANRAAGETRRLGLTLISLGLLLPDLGRTGEAITYLQEARELFAGIASSDPYNEVRALSALAAARFRAGDRNGATALAIQVAERMQRLGSESERAEALFLLGQIAAADGDVAGARGRYQVAVEVFDRLGSSRAAAVRTRLGDIG